MKNLGISRYSKIPIYLDWVDKKVDKKIISEFADRFSELVIQKIVKSKWVPGFLNFLYKCHPSTKLFVVTATPEPEIIKILKELKYMIILKECTDIPELRQSLLSFLLKNIVLT